MTSQETITNVFNSTVQGCRRMTNAKPRLQYEPGCSFIECDAATCKCAMNDGEGGSLSGFIAKWQQQHGLARN